MQTEEKKVEPDFSVNERIIELMSTLNLNPTSFASQIGLGGSTLHRILKKEVKPGYDSLKSIIESTYVNSHWLITGVGKMFRNEGLSSTEEYLVKESSQPYIKEFTLRTDKRQELQRVPLYNYEAAAGLVELFNSHQQVINYIQIPNMPRCDGAIFVSGDSMYPLLKSGDIVAYKKVGNYDTGIMFGEMYILTFTIEDDEITAVKYIQKSDSGSEFVKLVSYNAHHQPKDIPLKSIKALALVKVSIRMQSMA